MNEQHVSQIILKIFTDFKWKLKIADRSVEEVNALIDAAIEQIRLNIPVEFSGEAIERFQIMKIRLSEFVVDGRVMIPGEPAPGQLPDETAPNKCQKCQILPIVGHRPSVEKETDFFLLCPKCGAEGLSSLNPALALQNWNEGMID